MAATGPSDSGWKSKLAGEGLNSILGIGFTIFGTYNRMKEGESLIPALAKEAAFNVGLAMVPGGMIGGAVVMAAMSAPAIIGALDEAGRSMGKKYAQFGGGFQASEAQEAMKTEGMERMMRSREYYDNRQAMRNHKTY